MNGLEDPFIEIVKFLSKQSLREFAQVNKAFHNLSKHSLRFVHTITNRDSLYEEAESPYKNQGKIELAIMDLSEQDYRFALAKFRHLSIKIFNKDNAIAIAELFARVQRQVTVNYSGDDLTSPDDLQVLKTFKFIGELNYHGDIIDKLVIPKVEILKVSGKLKNLDKMDLKEVHADKSSFPDQWHESFFKPQFFVITGLYDLQENIEFFLEYRKYIKGIEAVSIADDEVVFNLGIPIELLVLMRCSNQEIVKMFSGPERICSSIVFKNCDLEIPGNDEFKKIVCDRSNIKFTNPVMIDEFQFIGNNMMSLFESPSQCRIAGFKIQSSGIIDFKNLHVSESLRIWHREPVQVLNCNCPINIV